MAYTEQLAQLLKNLVEYFDQEELRTLCFNLGVDYHELRGEIKSAKARELVTVMLRQNRLAELVSTLQALRPNVTDWPNVDALSPEERLKWTTQTEMQSAADYLAAMRDYCASLPYLSLHDIRPSKTLDEVYVPLKAKAKVEAKVKDKVEEERARSEWERSGPLSIAEVMRRRDQPHVLILGEPGAGKSTLLRQMAERAWDAPDKIGLDAPCLPILVPLRRLAESDGSLEDRLHRALTGELALTQDLPQGFFSEWPKQTGANWLLLLDALDEVPTDQRPRLMDWLKRIFNTIAPNRIVITSRPSGYSPGELDDTLFGHYDLLSFTPEQTGEFARKWFGDDKLPGSSQLPGSSKADHFIKELDRVRAGDLRGTPLLLTIAAKVYLEKGTLPQRRSALYDQFVSIWLAEAEQRGLRAELGDAVCDVARFALARLALAMTEQPTQSEASLSQVVAAYLQDAIPLSADRAQVMGERFVRVMARRSGVFTCRGVVYGFIHSTFREYLAAITYVRQCSRDLQSVQQYIGARWKTDRWHDVVLFIIGILSDQGVDATDIVWRIAETDDDGLFFAGSCLAEYAKVDAKLQEYIANGLLGLANTEKGPIFTRVAAAELLAKLGRTNKLHDGFLSLAQDGTVDDWAATMLHKLGLADLTVNILQQMIDNPRTGLGEHKSALEALRKLGNAKSQSDEE